MKEEKKKRWEEVITSTNMTHNSHKAGKIIKHLSNDSTSPITPCLVSANQVAHQLFINSRGTMSNKPIYKSGDKSLPSNYHPISLTPILIKIFVRVVRKQVTQFITERGYLNSSQHCFREGRSCLSALLSVFDDLMLMFTESSCTSVNMIYLDFSKAFDKVIMEFFYTN